MNQASKEFWDMLFILYLTQQKATKIRFNVSIGAAPVVDGVIFNASDFVIPIYYTFEKESFGSFYINSQVQVSKKG